MTSPLRRLAGRLRAALVAAALAALATLTVLFAPAPDGDARPDVRYAALGDSYAAGVGAGRYESGDGAGCGRSANAYPRRWEGAHHPAAFTFLACSGAEAADVVADQVPKVSADTTLVTVSVGGNDAGFTGVLVACSIGSDGGCVTTAATASARIATAFPALLGDTYAAIRRAAPKARVIAVGYPRLYEDGPCPQAVSQAKRSAINDVAVVLNEAIRAAAEKAGATYLDVAARWAGHGVCGAEPWINPMTYPVDISMHPTAIGQWHILELLEGAVRPTPAGTPS